MTTKTKETKSRNRYSEAYKTEVLSLAESEPPIKPVA